MYFVDNYGSLPPCSRIPDIETFGEKTRSSFPLGLRNERIVLHFEVSITTFWAVRGEEGKYMSKMQPRGFRFASIGWNGVVTIRRWRTVARLTIPEIDLVRLFLVNFCGEIS
jgi:hypothetical protein